MLARRFTIVCLLAALFGMAFSNLLAHSGSGRTDVGSSLLAPCGFGCSPQSLRF